MKNQYFGDINDYRKYSLLRLLSGNGTLSTTVCWMLTPNDDRPDGHRIQYLSEPETWRRYDPIVFDHLQENVIERNNRSVTNIEHSGILANCRFYSDIIPEDKHGRIAYMRRFLEFASGSSLVFFDPDNGMEIKSVRLGSRNSSKYLYFSEVQKAFSGGNSILVYQHLPQRPQRPLVSELVSRFRSATKVTTIYLYWTQFVVFFLIPQPAQEKSFITYNKRLSDIWNRQIDIFVIA